LLERCGLSSHVVEQVQTHMHMQGYRGPRIIFSIHEASTSSKSIEELLNELFTASETPPFLLPQEWNSMEFLKSWLSRLSNMADYNAGKGARRKALASLVLSFIRHAIQDPTFQEVFFTVLKEGSSTCGDRMALSILNLGIAYKLSQVDQKALKELASLLTRGSLALEILQEIASDKVKKLCGCDPIEVYLGYPVMLKEALKLPIDVEEMLYFRCSSLKKEDLEAAKNIVLARFADKEGLYKELCQRDLWIKALKENYPTKAEEIEAKQQTLSEAGNYDVQNIKEEWIALTKETLDSWTP